jgi:lysophospholipase L1-like esterase
VLGVFLDIIRKATGTTDWYAIMSDPALLAKAVTALNSPSAATRLKKGIKTFRKNFPYIVSRIRALNPKARFVVTTAYSPYHGIVITIPGMVSGYDLGALSDQMIAGLNQVYSEVAKTKKGAKIVFVDLAIPFAATPGLLNAELTPFTVNMDPHPNAAGQQVIAKLILDRIQDMFA